MKRTENFTTTPKRCNPTTVTLALVVDAKYNVWHNVAHLYDEHGKLLRSGAPVVLECEQIYSKVYDAQHGKTVDADRRVTLWKEIRMERTMRMARRGPHLPLRPHQMRDKSRRKRVIPVFLRHFFCWTVCFYLKFILSLMSMNYILDLQEILRAKLYKYRMSCVSCIMWVYVSRLQGDCMTEIVD